MEPQPTAREIALAPTAVHHATTELTQRPYSYYHGPIYHWDTRLRILYRNRPIEVVPTKDDIFVPYVAK